MSIPSGVCRVEFEALNEPLVALKSRDMRIEILEQMRVLYMDVSFDRN